MNPSARSCPVCGRELPQFSDCGGFYDIVPTASRSYTERVEQPQMQQMNESGYQERPAPVAAPVPAPAPQTRRRRKQKRSLLPLVSICVSLLLALIMLICMLFMMSRIHELEEKVDERFVRERTEQTEETVSEAPPEIDYKTAQLEFDAMAPEEGEIPEPQYGCLVTKTRIDQNVIKAECNMEAEEQMWKADMTRDGYVFTCTYEVDPAIFGKHNGTNYTWEVWTAENGWRVISESEEAGITITAANEQTSILEFSDEWQTIYAQGQEVKIRCTVTRNSQDNGSVKIHLGELVLPAQEWQIPSTTPPTTPPTMPPTTPPETKPQNTQPEIDSFDE